LFACFSEKAFISGYQDKQRSLISSCYETGPHHIESADKVFFSPLISTGGSVSNLQTATSKIKNYLLCC